MAKCARHEKYIIFQKKKSGSYFIVKFTYKSGSETHTYTKCFSVSDYGTQTECLNAACKHRDIKRAELAGGGFADRHLTINECTEIYVAKKHMTASSKKVFYSRYNSFIKKDFGERMVDTISALEIEESLAVLRYEQSDANLKRIFSDWKAIISTARKLRAVQFDVTQEVEVPKSRYYPKERTAKTVTDENIDQAISELRHFSNSESVQYNADLLAYIIIICRQTGLRPAEVFAIRRSNIDLLTHSLLINCSYGYDENGRAIVAPKTRTSVRTMPLTFPAELALKGAMAMSANEFIFTKWNGEIMNASDVSNIFQTLEKRGVKRFSIYSLRHQFSSDMITSNVDPRTVMELMGHNNTNTTVGVYARSNDEKKRNALEEIGRKIS